MENQDNKKEYYDLLKRENTLLKRENQLLKEENARVKDDISSIKSKVASFVQTAETTQENAKQTLGKNLLRLKVYELKLISYYNKLVQKYPIDDDISNVSEFIEELKNVLNKDFFSRENFELYGESKQLSGASPFAPESIIPNESGFDFFEAMHPDKDLEELCKELGLMSED